MNAEEYQFLAEFLRQRSGLSITSDKAYFVESRLKPIALRHGFRSPAQLVRELKTADDGLSRAVTDAMTTNETSFFRDQLPFDHFRDVMLPVLLDARRDERQLRFWCAACSTGQEAYSLAMILDGVPRLAGWDVDIVGSDINAEVIGRAKEGFYNESEVMRGLPIRMLGKYFHHQGSGWRVSATLRKRVRFEVLNLLDSFAGLGEFDAIFCRNVLIYFDQKTKQDVLNRLAAALAPDGNLVLGSAETMLGLSNGFRSVGDSRGVYLKAEPIPQLALRD